MNITIVTNRDIASALCLDILKRDLRRHNLTLFYTHKNTSPAKNTPKALRELSNFEASLLESTEFFPANCTQLLNNINQADDLQQFQSSQPDIVISIRHMTILQDHVICIPKHGVINLHSGLLPQYQGVMATFWAMLNQERHIGTTLHYIMDNSIDTGPIIERSRQEVEYQHSYLWNVLNLYAAGCANITKTVFRIAAGEKISPSPQNGSAKYFSYPSETDLNQFKWPLFNHTDALNEFFCLA